MKYGAITMLHLAVFVTLALAAPSVVAEDEKGFVGIKFMWDADQKLASIVETIKDSPAEKAGLKEGDLVTKINGKGSEDSEGFVKKVRAVKPGDTLTFTVVRDGKEKE